MSKKLILSPEIVDVMWKTIDRLPENLYDYDRDSFGLANLLNTCGFDLEVLRHQDGEIVVRGERREG